MYCSNCGKKIDDAAVFCNFCGNPVRNENNKKGSTKSGVSILDKLKNRWHDPKYRTVNILSIIALILLLYWLFWEMTIGSHKATELCGLWINYEDGQIEEELRFDLDEEGEAWEVSDDDELIIYYKKYTAEFKWSIRAKKHAEGCWYLSGNKLWIDGREYKYKFALSFKSDSGPGGKNRRDFDNILWRYSGTYIFLVEIILVLIIYRKTKRIRNGSAEKELTAEEILRRKKRKAKIKALFIAAGIVFVLLAIAAAIYGHFSEKNAESMEQRNNAYQTKENKTTNATEGFKEKVTIVVSGDTVKVNNQVQKPANNQSWGKWFEEYFEKKDMSQTEVIVDFSYGESDIVHEIKNALSSLNINVTKKTG